MRLAFTPLQQEHFRRMREVIVAHWPQGALPELAHLTKEQVSTYLASFDSFSTAPDAELLPEMVVLREHTRAGFILSWNLVCDMGRIFRVLRRQTGADFYTAAHKVAPHKTREEIDFAIRAAEEADAVVKTQDQLR